MLEGLKRGKVVRPRHSVTGDGALVVLVDSIGPPGRGRWCGT